MQVKFGYGRDCQEFTINENNLLKVLSVNPLPPGRPEMAEVAYALEHPIGTPRLREIVKPGEKVVIITSDVTRPMPTRKVLPLILAELQAGGVALADIQVVLALGSHRAHTPQEQRYLVGEELFEQLKVVDSDPQDVVRLGITRQGTPVDIFRPVAEADRRICLGNIEFHYFAGYSGGAKAIMPGVSTREAIQCNHRFMVDPQSRTGELDANPVRRDLEEAIQLVPIDFILNVVLDDHKNIVKAVAGDYQLAHREGCRFLDQLYKVEIPALADIVLVTPGGHPKDLNLYQAQKALDNAQHAVRPGGIIILVAACGEGLGERVFERWMINAARPEQLVEEIQQNFELGGHKAAAIGMVMGKARVFLVSEMEPALVRQLFMEPFPTAGAALAEAYRELGEDARIILMPVGGSTLPVYKP
jgi:nickel-dependent lactate racemase